MDIDTVRRCVKLVSSSEHDLSKLFARLSGAEHAILCDAYEKLNKVYELLDREIAIVDYGLRK